MKIKLKFIEKRIFFTVQALVLLSSCAFNFELVSQRTALENQMMGRYRPIDDRNLLATAATIREDDSKDSKTQDHSRAAQAVRNQAFNADDIEDLKDAQIIGESREGELQILPKNVGLRSQASVEQMRLAQIVVAEENRDRSNLWQKTFAEKSATTDEQLLEIRRQYALVQINKSKEGHWFQNTKSEWEQKINR